ncbi:MAG: aldo/keto reductase family protein [Nannocystaceae bacterium]
MKYRRLGSTGMKVSRVSLGSWLTLGSSIDAKRGQDLVACAYERGVNLFDTADIYADGGAEEALGRALAGIPRHHVVLATKCFFRMSDRPNDRGLSRKHIVESVHASLRRLGTDYIDLHQCHRPDPETPVEETVRAYEDLIRQGKVLYWGVSEWSADEIEEACRIADTKHAFRPVSNQPQYSIVRRQIEANVLPTCRRAGIGQIVFSPLAQGTLTGKYSGGGRPEGSRATDSQRNQFMGAHLTSDALARVDQLRPLAAQLDASLAQLALAWCLRDEGVASVIIGATRTEQIIDSCGASDLALPTATLDAIDRIFPA